jgi:hypothetical protein
MSNDNRSISIGGNITSSTIVTGSIYDGYKVQGNIANQITGNTGVENSSDISSINQQLISDAMKAITILIGNPEKYELSSKNTTVGKMRVVTKLVEEIDRNPSIKQKIIKAIKAGGIEAFAEHLDYTFEKHLHLNYPASRFIMGVLEEWRQEQS